MKLGFTKTVTIKLSHPITEAFLYTVRNRIERKYDIPYVTAITPAGFTMHPGFKIFSTYSNSFWPEITAERTDSPDTYRITYRPCRYIRVFMTVWFSFLAFMLAFLLLLAIVSSDTTGLITFFAITLFMMLFGYLLTKLGTDFSANKIIDAILCRNL